MISGIVALLSFSFFLIYNVVKGTYSVMGADIPFVDSLSHYLLLSSCLVLASYSFSCHISYACMGDRNEKPSDCLSGYHSGGTVSGIVGCVSLVVMTALGFYKKQVNEKKQLHHVVTYDDDDDEEATPYTALPPR